MFLFGFLFFVSLMVHALIRNRLYPLQYMPWLEVASFLSIVHALIFNLIPSHIANLFSFFFSLFFVCVCLLFNSLLFSMFMKALLWNHGSPWAKLINLNLNQYGR